MNRFFNLITGPGLFLMLPSAVFAADRSAQDYGRTTAGYLISILAAWGIYKSIVIARRETTNTKCAISLGFSLAGFFLIYGGSVIKPHFSDFRIIAVLAVIFAGVFFVTSMVLAIIGLIEYNQKFTQGKKQAIWAIILNSLVILLVVSGILIGIARQAEKRKEMHAIDNDTAPIVNPDLNFTMEVPGKPYAKIKPETINPYAKLAFMRGKPQIFYMLIPERIGIDQGMKTQDLYEIAQAALKGGSTRLKIGPLSKKQINGMNGLYCISDATVNNQDVSYVHWVCSTNGFSYQQIAFSKIKDKALLIKEAEKLFSAFKQIDRNTVCYSQGSIPLEHYESGQFGYALNLPQTSWLKWSDVNKTIPGADIGGKTGDNGAAFIISPISLEQFHPGDEAIIAAFLQSLAIDRDDQTLSLLSDRQYISFHDYIFAYSRTKKGSSINYRIKISVGPTAAFLISVWADKKNSAIDRFFEQIADSIQYIKPRPFSDSQRFDSHGKKVMADIVNRVGIIFENNQNYEQAAKYYPLAIAFDPADEIFWDNAMKIFNHQKKHEQAVGLLKKYAQTSRLSNNTLAWFAWHLGQTGSKSEAVEKYQQLFSSGYTNTEDFKYYMQLLVESGELKAVDPAYEAYLKQEENPKLRLHQAQTWYGQKQFEKALSVLDKLDQKSPDIIIERIYNLQELGRHREAMELCSLLISKNTHAGDGYYLKGKSEYFLKWYTKAKTSFEKSLAYFPGNTTINGYLKELSGILGQGDNSIIKKKILPVPLPEEVAKQMLIPVDPDYVKGDGAYYLQHCFGYKWEPDGVVKTTLRHKIHIVNSTGANDFSTYSINFNPLYEQVHVNSLLVRDKEGKKIAEGNLDSYFIVDRDNSNLKTHERTLNMPIPQLVPGCTIEIVATKILGNYDQFPFTERFLAGRHPIVNSMVYVLGDAEKFDVKAGNGVKTKVLNNGKMAYISTPMKYRREPNQQPYQLILPCVYINGKGMDWARQGESYLKKIQKQLTITPDIKKLALSLIGKTDTKNEKIAKLYRYLQQNYKYLGIEFGSRGEIPYEASKTVNNKFGDCKDHAVLFHHLLESAGIPNYLALVNSDHPVIKEMPSRDQFNHIINYIPGTTDRFLDATDKDSAAALSAPTYLAGFQALILEPDNIRFLKIPEYNPQETHIHVNRTFHVEDSLLHVNETLEMDGHYAAFMRGFLKSRNADGRQSWGQATIQAYYPFGRLEKIVIKNLMENDKPIIIDFSYTVSGRIQALKQELIVNTTGIWEPYYLFSEPVNDRKTKFEIRLPFLFSSHTEMKVPDGFSISEDSKNPLSSKTEFGAFDIKFDPGETALAYHLKLTAFKGVFPKDDYQAYYRFKQDILQAAAPKISLTMTN